MKLVDNKKAYTIVIVIILIGFMIFLTTGIFRLVLNERRDNESIGNYSKTYIGAETAQEIALLNIKEKGYGYNEGMDESDILGDNNKTPKISYTNNGKTNSYSGIIEPLSYNIMPLFYIKEDGIESKIRNYDLVVNSGDLSKFSWNIVGKSNGISGDGRDTIKGAKKSINSGNNFSYNLEMVSDFLSSSDTNYLILFNNSGFDISYKISSESYFTKPKISIISSSSVGYFKQNIKTDINYADVVNRAKYSIYSQK